MKAIKRTITIFFFATIAWLCFQWYKISNNSIGFDEFTHIPIALAFGLSLLLVRLNMKGISFLLFCLSTTVLFLGLFSLISSELLFKSESIILLFFGAFTLYTLNSVKPKLSLTIFFGTALIFSFSLVFEISNLFLQVTQIGFGILSTVLAIVGAIKKSN